MHWSLNSLHPKSFTHFIDIDRANRNRQGPELGNPRRKVDVLEVPAPLEDISFSACGRFLPESSCTPFHRRTQNAKTKSWLQDGAHKFLRSAAPPKSCPPQLGLKQFTTSLTPHARALGISQQHFHHNTLSAVTRQPKFSPSAS